MQGPILWICKFVSCKAMFQFLQFFVWNPFLQSGCKSLGLLCMKWRLDKICLPNLLILNFLGQNVPGFLSSLATIFAHLFLKRQANFCKVSWNRGMKSKSLPRKIKKTQIIRFFLELYIKKRLESSHQSTVKAHLRSLRVDVLEEKSIPGFPRKL